MKSFKGFAQSLTIIALALGLASCGVLRTGFKRSAPAGTTDQGKNAMAGAGVIGFIGNITGRHVGAKTAAGAVAGAVLLSNPKVIEARLRNYGINVFEQGDFLQVVVPNDLVFEPGDADIRLRAHEALQDIGFLLRMWSNKPIDVEGHSDDFGSTGEKYHLSYDRAYNIACYLWEHGLPRKRFHVNTVSDCQPTAELTTASGRADNRVTILTTMKSEHRLDFHWAI